jgi:hypothetical protein
MIRNFVIRNSVHYEFSALRTLLLRNFVKNFVIRNFVIRNFVIRNFVMRNFVLVPSRCSYLLMEGLVLSQVEALLSVPTVVRELTTFLRIKNCILCTVKKVIDFPVPSRDVTYQTLHCRK